MKISGRQPKVMTKMNSLRTSFIASLLLFVFPSQA